MNENIRMIRDARELLKNAAGEHCKAYSELAGGKCADAVLSVLDGELRMTDQLSKLENLYAPSGTQRPANEYEVNKFIMNEQG